MTMAKAIVDVHALGLRLRRRDGEFRVNWKGGSEETAYYTDDLEDAVKTAKAMYKRGRWANSVGR